ncbi:MAG: BON domain-containing protein [Pirellulaceae bacterium]
MPAIAENHTPFAIGDSVNNMLSAAHVFGVNCQCAGSLVVLRGTVATSQLKQQAITIARQLCGMREIANEIEVG